MHIGPIDMDAMIAAVKPMFYLALVFALYSIFIFKFYRFTAHKDIFRLYLYKRNVVTHARLKNFVNTLLYILEYLVIFPFVVFVWFAVLFILFVLISKLEDIHTIMAMAIVVVSTIRITAYYNEELSRDVAKLIPFSLMAFFLIDNAGHVVNQTFLNYAHFSDLGNQFIVMLPQLPYYLLYLVVLEFALRILYHIFLPMLNKDKDFQKEERKDAIS